MKRKIFNQKGSALYLVIIITSLLFAIVLGLNSILIFQKIGLKEIENSLSAFFVGDSGMEYILYLNSKCHQENCPSFCLSNCQGLPLNFTTSSLVGKGEFSVEVPKCHLFRSQGRFRGVTRAIEGRGLSYKMVFATQVSNGNLGGISGADIICQNRASAAGLPGTYKAWITGTSSSTAPAKRFTTSSLPYIRTDCTIVARGWKDLTDGNILAPINKDENRTTISDDSKVFTNTNFDGTQTGNKNNDCCHDWGPGGGGVNYGIISTLKTDKHWTESSSSHICHNSAYIYCFQQ